MAAGECEQGDRHDAGVDGRLKPKVAIVCHIWSHYREAVGRRMMQSRAIDYHIFSSGDPLNGIKHADIQHLATFHRSPYHYVGRFLWQTDAVRLPLTRRWDAVVLLGDPNFVSTWAGALACRLFGVPCFYWTHGWLRPETGLRRRIRDLFYRLPTRLLLYSERGRALGGAAGFPEERMSVIYNSLDTDRARDVVSRIEAGTLHDVDPRALFADPHLPLLICSGRLTERVGLGLLLDAAILLRDRGRPVNVLLVGEGPEREQLAAKAAASGLSVHFFGACSDEDIVGQLIYHADLTVAPGKLGLTAMHTLMYGTPAITHGDLDRQMPEVEAIHPGVTGALFRDGDAADLAETIHRWLADQPDRAAVRRAAFAEIEAKWTPERQAEIIERTILDEIHRRG